MTFEALCHELEKRSRRDIDVCAFHTRLTGKTAYALSISKHGLFVVLSHPEQAKYIQLTTMKLTGGETRYCAQIHTVEENNVMKMAYLTMEFFYERLFNGNLGELRDAFPDLNRHQEIVTIQSQELDLTEFPT